MIKCTRAEAVGGSCDYTLTLPTAPQPEPHLGPQTSVRLGLAFSAPGAGCEAREAPKGPACQGVRPKRAGHLRSPSRPGPARSRQSSSALEWGLAWDRQAVRDSGTSSATSQTWPTMALRVKSLSHVQLFVPGESHGLRSLRGYSPRGRKESDITDAVSTGLERASLQRQ